MMNDELRLSPNANAQCSVLGAQLRLSILAFAKEQQYQPPL
jgi:hypothetical protein